MNNGMIKVKSHIRHIGKHCDFCEEPISNHCLEEFDTPHLKKEVNLCSICYKNFKKLIKIGGTRNE